jgi:hypothetical protein
MFPWCLAGMVNFLCQLSWAMMPRYLVKHYSGCFCDVLKIRLAFRSVEFKKSRLLSTYGWAPTNHLKVLVEEKLLLRLPLCKKEFCQKTILNSSCNCSLGLQPASLPTDFAPGKPPQFPHVVLFL